MIKKISIIGAGGHARSVINLLELNGVKIAGIYDATHKNKNRETVNGYPLIGKPEDAFLDLNKELILAIGDNKIRAQFYKKFFRKLYRANLIHPAALIEKRVKIGISNQVFANVYINSGVSIGDNNILNTGCIIEHESKIGSHNHISVGTIICGRVNIADRCFIAAGCVVIDRISICNDVIVGANSVVIKDIIRPGSYVGNPARKIK